MQEQNNINFAKEIHMLETVREEFQKRIVLLRLESAELEEKIQRINTAIRSLGPPIVEATETDTAVKKDPSSRPVSLSVAILLALQESDKNEGCSIKEVREKVILSYPRFRNESKNNFSSHVFNQRKRGLIEVVKDTPRKKIYKLTEEGRKFLSAHKDSGIISYSDFQGQDGRKKKQKMRNIPEISDVERKILTIVKTAPLGNAGYKRSHLLSREILTQISSQNPHQFRNQLYGLVKRGFLKKFPNWQQKKGKKQYLFSLTPKGEEILQRKRSEQTFPVNDKENTHRAVINSMLNIEKRNSEPTIPEIYDQLRNEYSLEGLPDTSKLRLILNELLKLKLIHSTSRAVDGWRSYKVNHAGKAFASLPGIQDISREKNRDEP